LTRWNHGHADWGYTDIVARIDDSPTEIGEMKEADVFEQAARCFSAALVASSDSGRRPSPP